MKTSACLLLVLLLMPVVLAQDTRHEPKGNLFPGPGQGADGLNWVNEMESWSADPKADFPYWLHDLKVWRHERLTRMGYDDAQYRRPELQWAQRDFIQPQMMAEERYFYDPVKGEYTVDRYLDDLDDPLRRYRQRAHLARVSQHRHRQSQSVGPSSRPAGRHSGAAPDGRRFSPARRARLVPEHALGQRDARRGRAVLDGHGQDSWPRLAQTVSMAILSTACRAPTARRPMQPATRSSSNPRARPEPMKA